MRFRALGSRLSPATAEQVLNYRLGIVEKNVAYTALLPDLACHLPWGRTTDVCSRMKTRKAVVLRVNMTYAGDALSSG
jgi:hypothetical protein